MNNEKASAGGKVSRADGAAAKIAGRTMNCSQSVLTAYCEELGLDTRLARKIALGFGGGMGHTGKTCGAVTGAFMVIGLKQADLNPENAQQIKEKAYEMVKEFSRRFTEIHGSTACNELLGYDLGTAEGLAAAREKNLFATLCPKFVHDAVEILEKLLQSGRALS
jgi:C_GCAxxG_C_C family probable redox protein